MRLCDCKEDTDWLLKIEINTSDFSRLPGFSCSEFGRQRMVVLFSVYIYFVFCL